MKKGLTELVFILDRSGSMSGLEKDTIGGFNSMIEKQKQEEGEVLLTTILFDDKYEVLHNRVPLDEIVEMTEDEYYPRGMTALLDSVGKTILSIRRKHESLNESKVPENVLFVITTDGHENASKEYSYFDIKKLIKKQEEIHNWEFLFLGANIDSTKEASKLGIRKERSVNFHADKDGVKKHYSEINKTVSDFRASSMINDEWNKEIVKDFNSRKKSNAN